MPGSSSIRVDLVTLAAAIRPGLVDNSVWASSAIRGHRVAACPAQPDLDLSAVDLADVDYE